MMVPKDINQTPPGTWKYTHPTTGTVISGAYSLGRIISMVREYDQANGFETPRDIAQLIVEQTCERSPEYCVNTEPPTYAQRAVSFARAATDWLASGFKSVPHDVFESRKQICLQCPYWRGESMMGYGSCGKCGCSALKLFLPNQKCPDNRWKSYV